VTAFITTNACLLYVVWLQALAPLQDDGSEQYFSVLVLGPLLIDVAAEIISALGAAQAYYAAFAVTCDVPSNFSAISDGCNLLLVVPSLLGIASELWLRATAAIDRDEFFLGMMLITALAAGACLCVLARYEVGACGARSARPELV